MSRDLASEHQVKPEKATGFAVEALAVLDTRGF